ncbi:hypothetical protein VP01_1318g1 [Puccinia sorghi]|uniref:Uncharacterized protein n=1 Tax=Puccinia sorghi TaxID=27349 RepID=A0A0L6VMP4_9BASI|nr:hypothetical protein VP01_1318g1 [Puccinia sorghi]
MLGFDSIVHIPPNIWYFFFQLINEDKVDLLVSFIHHQSHLNKPTEKRERGHSTQHGLKSQQNSSLKNMSVNNEFFRKTFGLCKFNQTPIFISLTKLIFNIIFPRLIALITAFILSQTFIIGCIKDKKSSIRYQVDFIKPINYIIKKLWLILTILGEDKNSRKTILFKSNELISIPEEKGICMKYVWGSQKFWSSSKRSTTTVLCITNIMSLYIYFVIQLRLSSPGFGKVEITTSWVSWLWERGERDHYFHLSVAIRSSRDGLSIDSLAQQLDLFKIGRKARMHRHISSPGTKPLAHKMRVFPEELPSLLPDPSRKARGIGGVVMHRVSPGLYPLHSHASGHTLSSPDNICLVSLFFCFLFPGLVQITDSFPLNQITYYCQSDTDSVRDGQPLHDNFLQQGLCSYCYDLVTPSGTCQGFPQLWDHLQPPHIHTFPS